MALGDDEPSRRILEIFAAKVAAPRSRLDKILETSAADLLAGLKQGEVLLPSVLHLDPAFEDPSPSLRFPNLPGVAHRFGEGLIGNPDFEEEISCEGTQLHHVVALDLALGRLVFAGQLLEHGGSTGAVAAGTAAQRLCLHVTKLARARSADPQQPIALRGLIEMAFAETFKLLAAQRETQPGSAPAGPASGFPPIDKAVGETTLDQLLETLMNDREAPHGGTPPSSGRRKPAADIVDPTLYAKMRSIPLEPALAGVQFNFVPADQVVTAVMEQDPAAPDAVSFPLSRLARHLLPLWLLSPKTQAIYQRQMLPDLPSFAARVCSSLRTLHHNLVAFEPVRAEHIEGLLRKRDLYTGFRLQGTLLANCALRQRRVSGGLLYWAIKLIMDALEARLRDPAVPAQRKDRLLNSFTPALLNLEDTLRAPQQSKESLARLHEKLEEQLAEAQDEASFQEVTLHIRQNLLSDRQALFAAARRFARQQAQQPDSGLLSSSFPGPAAPGAAQRPRII